MIVGPARCGDPISARGCSRCDLRIHVGCILDGIEFEPLIEEHLQPSEIHRIEEESDDPWFHPKGEEDQGPTMAIPTSRSASNVALMRGSTM